MMIAGYPLPTWLGWPLALLAAVAIAGTVEAAGVAIALRGFESKAGAERFRAAHTARWISLIHLLFLTPLVAASLLVGGNPDPRDVSRLQIVAVGYAAFLAIRFIDICAQDRTCRPPPGPSTTWRETAMLAVLGSPTVPIFALLAALAPTRLGYPSAAVLFVGLAHMVVVLYGGWLAPFRISGTARPASGRLAAVVAEVAGRVGVHPRGVDVLKAPGTNAMALIVPKRLVYLGPILDVLDDAELAVITAHELGHLSEPRGVVRMRVALALFPVWCIALCPLAADGGIGMAFQAINFVALHLLYLAHAKVARRMEVRCDAIGREHEGEPGTYARALAKIYQANHSAGSTRSKRNAHPDLYDRMADAGAIPLEPRPKPPKPNLLTLLPFAAFVAAASLAIDWTSLRMLFL